MKSVVLTGSSVVSAMKKKFEKEAMEHEICMRPGVFFSGYIYSLFFGLCSRWMFPPFFFCHRLPYCINRCVVIISYSTDFYYL